MISVWQKIVHVSREARKFLVFFGQYLIKIEKNSQKVSPKVPFRKFCWVTPTTHGAQVLTKSTSPWLNLNLSWLKTWQFLVLHEQSHLETTWIIVWHYWESYEGIHKAGDPGELSGTLKTFLLHLDHVKGPFQREDHSLV